MSTLPQIGGQPVVRLTAPGGSAGPRLIEAFVCPGRGMLVAQVRAALPEIGEVDLLEAPPLEALSAVLDGGPQDFAGNASFSLGGAILLPFANRITGEPGPGRTLLARVGEGHAVLPLNWGGKAPGAPRYAMHGLILASPFAVEHRSEGVLRARLDARDFAGHWPGRSRIAVSVRLTAQALALTVAAQNVGEDDVPMGIGWHPYLRLHGGDRGAAVLTLPARSRLEVSDYDAVLPTGRILPVEGTAHDFRRGAALGGLYLDDCFVDLDRDDEGFTVEVADAACRVSLRTASPLVQAIQVYAPPESPFVVVEPQYNWPDPYSPLWRRPTGMARLAPGETAAYRVEMRLALP